MSLTAIIASVIFLLFALAMLAVFWAANKGKKERETYNRLLSSGYIGEDGATKLLKEGRRDDALTLLYFTVLLAWHDQGKELQELASAEDTAKTWLKRIIYTERLIDKLDFALNRHIKTLSKKFRLLVTDDDYGVIDYSGWDREAQYFMASVAEVDLNNTDDAELSEDDKKLIKLKLEQRMLTAISDYLDTNFFPEDFTGDDPLEYEQWCSEFLTKNGWQSRRTSASGDQGADIVAEKAGISVVIQCKLYSIPVGNKAVQEVAAARSFYDADFAVVVGRSGFTSSAKTLSKSTRVLLLHHLDLNELDKKLSLSISR